jgi:hypothetical protein
VATFALDIDLTGTGWAAASLRAGEAHARITASYLSDAPRDLVDAARIVADGADDVRCSWAEEPGEFRWRLHRIDADLEVEILAFDCLNGRQPDEAGRLLFYARIPARDFVRSVLRAMDALVERLGSDGYAELWALYDYPHEQVEGLRAAYAAMNSREDRRGHRRTSRQHP